MEKSLACPCSLPAACESHRTPANNALESNGIVLGPVIHNIMRNSPKVTKLSSISDTVIDELTYNKV